MSVFAGYAEFYDLLYGDKDYEAECNFLEDILCRYAQAPVQTILDLGCGTGGHAFPLVRRGYRVTGVDRSQDMLAIARSKGADLSPSPIFRHGDIRDLDLEETFDVVIAMFAVISYMTTNEDLLAAFRTARRHLRPGGLFVFDAWFGPAVLSQRPTDRCRVIERDGERIIRLVRPELHILDHLVHVQYRVLRLTGQSLTKDVDETHAVRFLFPQEILHLTGASRLRVRRVCPFMRLDDTPTESDWNFTTVAESV